MKTTTKISTLAYLALSREEVGARLEVRRQKLSTLAYLALSREAKLGAAREALQLTASTLRKLATTGGHCQELVNAAAKVEAVFDELYVSDRPAPLTRRSV